MRSSLVALCVALPLMAFSLTACDGLLDINEDPARIGSDEVTLPTLMPSAIRFTAGVQFGAAQYGAQYPQYLGGQSISQYTPYGFDQLWRPLYTDAFPTLDEMIALAEDVGAYHYSGIGKTLLGLNVMTAADVYGGVPFTEANQGPDEIYPCYDSMQDIYEVHLESLFNEAIDDLQRTQESGAPPVQGDYIYGGDVNQWLKAAYAARARYHLHRAQRDADYYDIAVEDARMAFDGYPDNLALEYESSNPNPWYNFIGNATTRPMQPTSFLVGLMNGAAAYSGVVDPRLPQYMETDAEDETYIGITPGMLVGEDDQANVNLTTSTWHSEVDAPLQFLTYSEMQFIIAESLLDSDANQAFDAFQEGIRASMEKVGVAAGDIDAYLTDSELPQSAGELTLSDVMVQKYIALFLQIEGWTDLRRHDFNPDVYPGLQKPVVNQIPGEPWARRSNVPDDEPGVNTCLPDFPNQGEPLWLYE